LTKGLLVFTGFLIVLFGASYLVLNIPAVQRITHEQQGMRLSAAIVVVILGVEVALFAYGGRIFRSVRGWGKKLRDR